MFVPIEKVVELPKNVCRDMAELRRFLAKGDGARVVDVFCGMGALSLGFESSGCAPALGMEKEPAQAATYAANRPSAPVALGDCTGYDPAELRKALGQVAGIVGGVPCEPFSRARGRDASGTDPRRDLIKYAVALVEAFKPRFFCFENVTAAVDHPNWKAAARAMSRAGYAIGIWRLAASDFGAATIRKRAFFVGSRGSGELEPPAAKGRARTVRDAFKGLGEPREGSTDHLHRPRGPMPASAIRAAAQAKPGAALRSVSGYHGPFGDKLLAFDEPAKTITSMGCVVHPSRKRFATAREYARIQGIPDKYKFPVTENQARSMLGDCVPVELGSAVAARLVRGVSKAAGDPDPVALAEATVACLAAILPFEDYDDVAKAEEAVAAAEAAMRR